MDKLQEKLRKYNVSKRLSLRRQRKIKKLAQRMRYAARKQQEEAAERSDAYVEQVFEQRRMIQEVENKDDDTDGAKVTGGE